MHAALQPGVSATVEIEVTPDMRPAFDGQTVHEVYSTWSLAHHMEIAARRVLAPHLEAHEEGIGTHLSIDHVAPAAVGRTVRIVATAVEVDPRGVLCDVTAHAGDTLIARGKQMQRVLPKPVLRELFARHGVSS